MATRAESLGRTSPRPNPRGGARTGARSPRPSRDAQLRVVPKPRARSARQSRRALVTVCVVLTVALAFGVVASQVIVAQNQNRLDKLNRRLDTAQTRYERLRYQLAELESRERVVATAHERLGMVEPTKVNFVAPVATNNNAAEETEVTDAPDWRLVKAELAAE
jgi:cell division protein FtsL